LPRFLRVCPGSVTTRGLVTPPRFRISAKEDQGWDRICASSNQLISWLRNTDCLRPASSSNEKARIRDWITVTACLHRRLDGAPGWGLQAPNRTSV